MPRPHGSTAARRQTARSSVSASAPAILPWRPSSWNTRACWARANGADLTAITDMAGYFSRELRFHIPTNYPFVGADFNNTAAGIHADGAMKNEEIYNIFDTTKLLNRPMGVIITDKSGIAGIAMWVNGHLALSGEKAVDKRHPGIAKIHKWVMEQYAQGRTTNISRDEMAEKVKKYLSEFMVSDLDVIKQKAKDIAVHLIEAVVAEEAFKRIDKKEMEKTLQKLLDENPFIQFAYVVNTDGKKITKNLTQIIDRATYEHSAWTRTSPTVAGS